MQKNRVKYITDKLDAIIHELEDIQVQLKEQEPGSRKYSTLKYRWNQLQRKADRYSAEAVELLNQPVYLVKYRGQQRLVGGLSQWEIESLFSYIGEADNIECIPVTAKNINLKPN